MDEVWYRAPDWATTNPLALTLYGIVGGALVAMVLVKLHRRSRRDALEEIIHSQQVSFDVINFSHLQVVGVGGLALVIICAMVAIVLPPIGISLGLGSLAGITLAIVLIKGVGRLVRFHPVARALARTRHFIWMMKCRRLRTRHLTDGRLATKV
jgi:hypothetical protein